MKPNNEANSPIRWTPVQLHCLKAMGMPVWLERAQPGAVQSEQASSKSAVGQTVNRPEASRTEVSPSAQACDKQATHTIAPHTHELSSPSNASKETAPEKTPSSKQKAAKQKQSPTETRSQKEAPVAPIPAGQEQAIDWLRFLGDSVRKSGNVCVIAQNSQNEPPQGYIHRGRPSKLFKKYLGLLKEQIGERAINCSLLVETQLSEEVKPAREALGYHPDLLLLLGESTVKRVFGADKSVATLRGKLMHTPWGFPAIVSYHPSTLRAQPLLKVQAWQDLQLIEDYLRHKDEQKV